MLMAKICGILRADLSRGIHAHVATYPKHSIKISHQKSAPPAHPHSPSIHTHSPTHPRPDWPRNVAICCIFRADLSRVLSVPMASYFEPGSKTSRQKVRTHHTSP